MRALLALAAVLAAGSSYEPIYPTVSPDGSRIAWVEGSTWRIWLARADGSDARTFGPSFLRAGIGALAWTKQGLVVSSNYTLFLLEPSGKRSKLAVVGDQSFSAGGSRVAAGSGQGAGPVTVVDLVTRKVVHLGARGTANGEPALSPDGRHIAWVSAGAIWVSLSSGGRARKLAAGSSPGWSPDGRSIAYLALGARGQDLHVVRSNGLGDRLLVRRAGGSFAWSPDSTRIAFTPQRVDVVDVADGRVIRSKLMGRATGGFAWSPDGASVYVTTRPLAHERAGNNCTNLWRLDAHTLRGRIAVPGCP